MSQSPAGFSTEPVGPFFKLQRSRRVIRSIAADCRNASQFPRAGRRRKALIAGWHKFVGRFARMTPSGQAKSVAISIFSRCCFLHIRQAITKPGLQASISSTRNILVRQNLGSVCVSARANREENQPPAFV
jgi:hypothetical protein